MVRILLFQLITEAKIVKSEGKRRMEKNNRYRLQWCAQLASEKEGEKSGARGRDPSLAQV